MTTKQGENKPMGRIHIEYTGPHKIGNMKFYGFVLKWDKMRFIDRLKIGLAIILGKGYTKIKKIKKIPVNELYL